MKKSYDVINFLLDLYFDSLEETPPPCVVDSRQILFGEVLLSKTLKEKEFRRLSNKEVLIELFFSLLRENNNLLQFIQDTPKEVVFFVLWSRWSRTN